MTPAEAASLLSLAAAYDNRKPDADAAQAWALALDGCRYEDCRTVVVDHYRRSNEWLMPNHVITEVKRLREKRLRETPEGPPPADLTPLETIAWLKDARRRIADGEGIPDAGYGELTERHLPDLRHVLPEPPDSEDEE